MTERKKIIGSSSKSLLNWAYAVFKFPFESMFIKVTLILDQHRHLHIKIFVF